MFLREITEKPAIKYSDEELSDDLLFYIEFDSDFYRKEVYPELVRFKRLAKNSDNVKTTFFVPMLTKAVKFYCEKFDEDSSRDCFKIDNLKQLSAHIYDREMEELHKEVEKTPRNANPNVTEDAAGVGTITKQNTTDDVNPSTIRKNLKAFKLEDTVNEISPDTVKSYMKGAVKDTLTRKNRNPGISRAMSRLSGTNQPLLPGETMPSINNLHLEISDHLTVPLDRFKLNLIDAEFLGDYLVKYAKVLSRKYGMNVDDVRQFINDYVEEQLGDID